LLLLNVSVEWSFSYMLGMDCHFLVNTLKRKGIK